MLEFHNPNDLSRLVFLISYEFRQLKKKHYNRVKLSYI